MQQALDDDELPTTFGTDHHNIHNHCRCRFHGWIAMQWCDAEEDCVAMVDGLAVVDLCVECQRALSPAFFNFEFNFKFRPMYHVGVRM